MPSLRTIDQKTRDMSRDFWAFNPSEFPLDAYAVLGMSYDWEMPFVYFDISPWQIPLFITIQCSFRYIIPEQYYFRKQLALNVNWNYIYM